MSREIWGNNIYFGISLTIPSTAGAVFSESECEEKNNAFQIFAVHHYQSTWGSTVWIWNNFPRCSWKAISVITRYQLALFDTDTPVGPKKLCLPTQLLNFNLHLVFPALWKLWLLSYARCRHVIFQNRCIIHLHLFFMQINYAFMLKTKLPRFLLISCESDQYL